MPSDTNYINDADQVLVVKVTEPAAPHVSLPIAAGTHSGMTTGKFIGTKRTATLFDAIEADASAAVLVPAIGCPILDHTQSYTVDGRSGNKTYERVDLYEDNITLELVLSSITLIPGPVWLSSGGGITQQYPQGVGNLRQMVGHAISTSQFVVNVQDPETIQS